MYPFGARLINDGIQIWQCTPAGWVGLGWVGLDENGLV